MKKKIFIADNDEEILNALKVIMEKTGYEVEVSHDGKTLLNGRHQWPDIILLDRWMGGTDGKDICKKLKSNAETCNIPVIILSASHDLEISAKESGANDFIAKPFNMRSLMEIITKHI